MHNRHVELGDGTKAALAVAPDKLGNLAIFAFVDLVGVLMSSKITTVGHWVLQTNLPIAHYCERPKERSGAFNRGMACALLFN
jgi:hypothetical protein